MRAVHHRPLEMVPDPEEWIAAHVAVAEKWEGRSPGVQPWPGAWEQRARQAEAERDVAYARAAWKKLEGDARVVQLERWLEETTTSVSWRVTAPLRRLGPR